MPERFGEEVARLLPQLRFDELIDELQARLDSVRSSRDRVARLLEAVVGIGSGLDLEQALARIVRAATTLVDARYGALGVIGGPAGLPLADRFLPEIRAAAAAHALRRPYAQTTIEACLLGPEAVAMGAATLPIARLLAEGGLPAVQEEEILPVTRKPPAAADIRPRTRAANCPRHSFSCDWPRLSEGIKDLKKLFGSSSSKAKGS